MTDEKNPERRTASEIQAINEQVAKEFKKKLSRMVQEAEADPMIDGIEVKIDEAYREFEKGLECPTREARRIHNEKELPR